MGEGIAASGGADKTAPGAPATVIPMSSAPIDPARPLTRVLFGSCAHQDREQEIWNAVRAADGDVFLFIGDNIYADETSGSGRVTGPVYIADAYRKLAASAPFAALRADTTVMTTWDDHDYGLNDAGKEFIYRDESKRLFLAASFR
ncbi:MAG: alkaline phosphatase D family protein [Pseudomonadota bacterium]